MVPEIEKLKKASIFCGTSSWKYVGWKGMVYSKPYTSEKAFNETALSEYSEQFACVGIDHTYYAWPTKNQMKRYFDQTPADFKFVLKASDKITVPRFPKIPRYGKQAGQNNSDFLNPQLFIEHFLEPIQVLEDKLGAIILEFSHFRRETMSSGSEFVDRLDNFLGEVRLNCSLPLAIELRNSNWLQPKYFHTLIKHQVTHVFNSWTQMPEIEFQWQKAKDFPLPFFIFRLLLKPGTIYQEAVDNFAPYERIQEPLPEIRASVVEHLLDILSESKTAFVLVNNRFEGCAPTTIQEIVTLLFSSKRAAPLWD
ncbi:MAG: DUF72 domain-containing protein [Proteobacteria bacterium]|nr:DUF72 domain-containing protein [Pseudomonadota bacterium]